MNLTGKEKISYGIGAFGKDLVYMLVSAFLLIYYNTVLGMDSVYIGFVLMAARIFDAFNDPFMGVIIAKTNTKWGKCLCYGQKCCRNRFSHPDSSDDGSCTCFGRRLRNLK